MGGFPFFSPKTFKAFDKTPKLAYFLAASRFRVGNHVGT
jgi:hypothetical protein